MPQLNYSLGPVPAVAGEIYDLSAIGPGDIVSPVAGTLIPFGVLCELSSTGVLQPVQDINANWPPTGATAATSLVGVSVYDPMGVMQDYIGSAPSVPPTGNGSSTSGWPKGMRVPVLRKGRIWMQFDGGGTVNRIGPINIWHSSDGTHPQGVVTFTATATTAGAEISTLGAAFQSWNPEGDAGAYEDGFGTTNTIICVSVNLPGAV
jgi:hypothetical protein